MNGVDKMLLEKASELYSVPFGVLEGVYRLGVAEGKYEGLK